MRRFAALGAAAALAVFTGGASLAGLYQTVDRDPVIGYPSLQEVTNFDVMARSYDRRREQGDNPRLVFGSSELNPGPAGPAHPASLLEGGDYGVDVMVTGRAFCEDLWRAIEVGAFAGRMDQDDSSRRVVLIPSMQWFMCYRNAKRDFTASFSQGAYDAFMANPVISDELKDQVTQRMAVYGVDRTGPSSPSAAVAAWLDSASDQLLATLRLSTTAVAPRAAADGKREKGVSRGADGGGTTYAADSSSNAAGSSLHAAPNWDQIFSDADLTAREKASSNAMGINDSWYAKHLADWQAGTKDWKVEGNEYFSEQEFEDFKLLLRVCREAGVLPMVLIQPVKGELYDQTIYGPKVRQRYYQMIRQACEQAGVPVADFSSHEYDTYFLREYSHPSDLGGAYYSKAIYTYLTTGVADTSPSGGVAFETRKE